jgi:gamma-glutamylcyclotransferase (GGCT)/AIG2-like uncharacterized protein YtfP
MRYVSNVSSLLFAYGTLREGETHHDALAGATSLSEAVVPNARLVDLGPYPALVEGGPTKAASEYTVVGELYEVDEAILARVDVVKEHPALFQRRLVELTDGRQAHAYFMQAEQVRGRRRIASGDWKKRFEARQRSEFTRPRRY